MSESIYDFNPLTLSENLDKWDKLHLPKVDKFPDVIRKISKRLTKEYDYIKTNNLNFKQSLSRNVGRLKTQTKNENLKNFYKNIEQEESNVLAQNINMVKQRFDFDVFNSPKKIKIKLDKTKLENGNSKLIIHRRSLTSSNIDKKENDELWKVGNELGIRKRIIFNSKTEKIKDNLEDYEEIKIEDRMLKLNDLRIEGNYTKVTSYDVYKSIVNNKKKIEKNFREQIMKLNNEIKKKENIIEDLNKELAKLTKDTEDKKSIYFDNSEVAKVIKNEIDKFDLKYDFTQKSKLTNKMHDIEQILEKSKNEYVEQKCISDSKIPEIKKNIHILKVEIKSLQEILLKVKKENIIYFKNLLKEGVDVRDVGLCWILFRLNELGAKIEHNDFPKFLDYVSINYLLVYSEKIIIINKLKILLDLVRNERKKIMKSVDFINHNMSNQLNLNDDFSIENNIEIPYDNIDEFLKELFFKYKVRLGNKFVILENYSQKKDEECLKNAQQYMRTMIPSYRNVLKKKKKNHFLTQTYTVFDSKKNYQLNLTSKQINTVDTILTIKNMMYKIDIEMKNIRSKHLEYFKRKYESMKLKGISECIKYDLMFCALFGNFAVY